MVGFCLQEMMAYVQFHLKINLLIAHLMTYLMYVVSKNQRKEASKLPVPFCPCTRASVLFYNSDETSDLVSHSQAEHFSEDDDFKRAFSVSGHPALLQFLSALLQTGKSIMAPTLRDEIRRAIRAERRGSDGSDRHSERVIFSFHLPESPCWSARERVVSWQSGRM